MTVQNRPLPTDPDVTPLPGAEDPFTVALSVQDAAAPELVRQAIRRNDVLLAFQPVIAATDGSRPVYYEGLVRIYDETGRVIPAGSFIHAVETQETGRVIDCLALDMGLAALASAPDLRLSVNLSARSIGYPRFTRTLDRALSETPGIAERLILEITERSAMLMPDIVTAFMRDLQRRGVAFALDDFGAGFTSFRTLRQFYFDLAKIDGEFVRGIARNADNQVLAQALVAVARHFDMLTVAESVESGEDAAALRSIGVDCMQGYYYGAPTIVPPWAVPRQRREAAGQT
jgi:EAL domain-containing protein (putative c-di-GMP-specific phosphodiesterase class I)